ncbi:MAG: DUF4330 domain-containing protein [Defluviitaleaceae bacterium]|nr:DUF4330 domain-containing protein [Defluviitaleaceae bacterium]
MDKNGKLFGKISIIDLAVILLILVVAAGAIFRFTSPNAAVDTGDGDISFTIRIEGVRDFTLDYYFIGLPVHDRQTNQFIGVISSIDAVPHYVHQVLHDGSVATIAMPDHITIYLGLEASARIEDGGIYAQGNYAVAVGSIININTRYVQVQGRIYSLELQ